MAKRRPTIGDNPLDSVIPDRKAPASTPPAARRGGEASSPAPTAAAPTAAPAPPPPAPARVAKERLTIHLPLDLIDQIKDAVYWTPGLTLAGFAEQALGEALRRLEDENGKSFPRRKAPLKGGRPLK